MELLQRKPEKFTVLKQFFFMGSVTIISLFIFSGIGVRLAAYFFNLDLPTLLSDDYSNASRQVVYALKFLQVFSTAGAFLTPAILFPLYLSKKPVYYLKIDKNISLLLIIQIIFLFILIYPFLEWVIALNDSITFPEVFKNIENSFRSQENKLALLTDTFLRMYNYRDLLTNIIVIAFLPALFEEIFFRGMFQNFMQGLLKNAHIAILISAAFFSLVHLSFFGFIPRLILGLILGYLFYWSGSLWASVFAHFLNNVTAVILVFLAQMNYINFQIDKPMNSSNLVTIASFAIAAMFFLFLASYYSKRRDKKKDWVLVYTSNNVTEVEILKGKLENNDIHAVVINKRDSSYKVFGPVELYVSPEEEQLAKEIIESVENSAEENNNQNNNNNE